jgi:hypothetical protein
MTLLNTSIRVTLAFARSVQLVILAPMCCTKKQLGEILIEIYFRCVVLKSTILLILRDNITS